MGLFDFLKKKDTVAQSAMVSPVSTATTTTTNSATTSTTSTSKSNVIDMSKSAENLNKVLINMSKTSKVDMSKHTARVALAMDYSGSMSNLFRNGSVQDVVTRLLPIALKFDDNGELESWLFSNGKERLKAVTANNYSNYVKNVMFKAKMSMGGTNYAPVLKDIVSHYKDIEPSTVPAFIIFITDGDNWDTDDTNRIVKELSNYNMFVQFVGIGHENFNYLRSLDDMKGRKHDNTGFIKVEDMNRMSDEELYTKLLEQYKNWLNGKQ